jgi:hypothetical protein
MALYRFPSVDCVLRSPLQVDGDLQSLQRFVRSYWVRAESVEAATEWVRRAVTEEDAEIVECAPAEPRRGIALPLWLLPRLALQPRHGILWRSGRVFYPSESA